MSTTTPARPSSLRWLMTILQSSVGGKYLVGGTGILLTGFVLVHMAGNLQIFLGRTAINRYAESLREYGPMLWVARGGLLTIFLIHIFLAVRLKLRSRSARPVRYQAEDTVRASWASRHMILTGLMILAFIAFHLAHYTFGVVHEAPVVIDGQVVGAKNFHDLQEEYVKDNVSRKRHDVYQMMIHGFRSLPVTVLYIIAQVLLGVHLYHGTASVFQTFGLNHPRWNLLIRLLANMTAFVIVAGNVLMPLAVYFRLLRLPGE